MTIEGIGNSRKESLETSQLMFLKKFEKTLHYKAKIGAMKQYGERIKSLEVEYMIVKQD